MQEDIERRTVALSISATKLTGRVLAMALAAAMRKIQKEIEKGQTPQGRQPVKKLMRHKADTNAMPLDGDTKLFDRIAKEFEVDYSFHKTGPNKYLLFFKAGQADAITTCFSEYTKRFMAKAKTRPSILEQLKKFGELVKSKGREPERTREAARDER